MHLVKVFQIGEIKVGLLRSYSGPARLFSPPIKKTSLCSRAKLINFKSIPEDGTKIESYTKTLTNNENVSFRGRVEQLKKHLNHYCQILKLFHVLHPFLY